MFCHAYTVYFKVTHTCFLIKLVPITIRIVLKWWFKVSRRCSCFYQFKFLLQCSKSNFNVNLQSWNMSVSIKYSSNKTKKNTSRCSPINAQRLFSNLHYDFDWLTTIADVNRHVPILFWMECLKTLKEKISLTLYHLLAWKLLWLVYILHGN